MKDFWNKLPVPFLALAPMEDVTNTAFRQVVAKAARPDVFFTEFMNVSGFCHPSGRAAVARRLKFAPTERPIVAQIWGSKPADFALTTQELAKMGFAGIDINMGCPDKSVVKSGGGSALIKDPTLAVEIIQVVKTTGRSESSFEVTKAVKSGVGEEFGDINSETIWRLRPEFNDEPRYDGREESVSGLMSPNSVPVLAISVKTRLGDSSVSEWKAWLTTLLEQDLDALTVHLRTRKEMSKVPAHHELIPDIIKLRDSIAPQTKLIINGDIANRAQAQEIYQKYIIYDIKIDGFMIGRGVFADPFCFEPAPSQHSQSELLDLLKFHLSLFDAKTQNYEPMKKFFKIYINEFPGAKELRAKLMETNSPDQALALLPD